MPGETTPRDQDYQPSEEELAESGEALLDFIGHDVLRSVYKSYPYPDYINDIRRGFSNYDSSELTEAIQLLVEQGLISLSHPGGLEENSLELTPDGLRRVLSERGLAAEFDVQKISQVVSENIDKISETIEANKHEQDNLAKQLQQSSQQFIEVSQKVEENTRKQKELDDKINNLERDFYSRIFPFFTVFIGTFAIVITSAQVVVRIESADPTTMFLRSAAIMTPIAILVLVLILVTWLVSRPRH